MIAWVDKNEDGIMHIEQVMFSQESQILTTKHESKVAPAR